MMYGQKTRTFFAVIIYYKASLHEVFSSLQQSAIRTADHERFCFATGEKVSTE
jgi:hypothetical protein